MNSPSASEPSAEQTAPYPPQRLPVRSDFLVCGLGSLGQYCVSELKEFGVAVSGLDIRRPTFSQNEHLPELLENLWIGDCRHRSVLEKAQVQRYRAVLLVTSDERVNIDAAFAVRLLNPYARLVVRSAKQTLNELLEDRLGNFVAFEATQLPTTAFAIAALGDENQGFIELEDQLIRVIKRRITPANKWWERRVLHELNTSNRRVLSHFHAEQENAREFYAWEPDERLAIGDTLTYLELGDRLNYTYQKSQVASTAQADAMAEKAAISWQTRLSLRYWRDRWLNLWNATAEHQSRRVALVVGLTVLFLLVLGMGVLLGTGSLRSPLKAFYATLMLLLGSYDALVPINERSDIPAWLQVMHLGYTLAGTASIAVLYALLTESLLVTKFQLPKKRPPISKRDHIIVVGLGRVGRGVSQFFFKLNQAVVGIHEEALESTVMPDLPIVVGNLANSLSRANLATARGVVICTNDEIANLEIGMIAHSSNPNCNLVIRTFDPSFSENVDQLLPYASVLCAYELAAQVYVAAAFGENIATLLRLDGRTIIVTEYKVETDDTLEGLLLSEVAYGYGVVPVLHHKVGDPTPTLLPPDDRRLEVGDDLTVLASSDSLQRIERGIRAPQTWRVRIERANSPGAVFDGTRVITRITNLEPHLANETMNNLPSALPKRLYKHQALRLVRSLRKSMVTAYVVGEE
jgi:Trk K+ transport system NAD-binding subunit